MVTIEQLRISDDGQKLYLDAHVNKASYFDSMTIKRVTVCTEEQVSELQPKMYGQKFIYQKDIEPINTIRPVYSDVQILSAQSVLDALNNGGLPITYVPIEGSTENYLSIVFSGKYSQFDTGFIPRLVVASQHFNPLEEGMNSVEILAKIDGEVLEKEGHRVWQFKGKVNLGDNTTVCLYLFNQTGEDIYEYVAIENTDIISGDVENATYNYNYLHVLWQVYSIVPFTNDKEVHLLLTKSSFDEAFNNTNTEGEAINPELPIATESLNGDLSSHIFFVYIECDGTPAINTPCGLDEATLGVTFDYGVIYNMAMNYTRELTNNCQMPQGFVDFILNTEALKLSLETEHYFPAIDYWKRILGNYRNNSVTRGCGCHG